MIHHPRFPDYVAVDHHSLTSLDRIRVLGQRAERLCFECPGRECGPKAQGSCPISGVWMHLTSVALLRLEGVPVRFDTTVNLEKLTHAHT